MIKLNAKIQHGFSMITAIFLLVVLGTLGAMMASFFGAQQQSSALDVMGARAYQAARAGIEWASYNISVLPAGNPWPACAAVSTPLGVLDGSLSPFTVTLNCTMSAPIVEGIATVRVYNITSTARTAGAVGSINYVERQMTVTLGH